MANQRHICRLATGFPLLGVLVASMASAGPIKTEAEMEGLLSARTLQANVLTEQGGSWEGHLKDWLSSSGAVGGIIQTEEKLIRRQSIRKNKGPVSGRELLDEMAAQNPSYRWTAAGGVINILPKQMDKGALVILSRPIKEFHSRAHSSTAAIFDLLRKNEFPVSLEPLMGGPKPKKMPKKKDYSCQSTTALDCINRIVALDDRGSWQLSYDKKRGGLFYLTRLGEATRRVDDGK